jgi:hypothetical protein
MKNLVAIAKDLNSAMGLDPKIPVVGISKEKLTAQIEKATALIDPENDEFKPETIKELKALGFWPGSDSLDDENPPELDLETLIQNATDIKELKALVKDREEFKSLRKRLAGIFDLADLKDDMLSLLDPDHVPEVEETPEKETPKPKTPKKEKETPKPKTPKKEIGTRMGHVIEVLKEKDVLTDYIIQEVAEEINTRFVENGGTDHIKESKADLIRVIRVLSIIGNIQKSGPGSFEIVKQW